MLVVQRRRRFECKKTAGKEADVVDVFGNSYLVFACTLGRKIMVVVVW